MIFLLAYQTRNYTDGHTLIKHLYVYLSTTMLQALQVAGYRVYQSATDSDDVVLLEML